jgi:hypothetical protein
MNRPFGCWGESNFGMFAWIWGSWPWSVWDLECSCNRVQRNKLYRYCLMFRADVDRFNARIWRRLVVSIWIIAQNHWFRRVDAISRPSQGASSIRTRIIRNKYRITCSIDDNSRLVISIWVSIHTSLSWTMNRHKLPIESIIHRWSTIGTALHEIQGVDQALQYSSCLRENTGCEKWAAAALRSKEGRWWLTSSLKKLNRSTLNCNRPTIQLWRTLLWPSSQWPHEKVTHFLSVLPSFSSRS